MTAERSLDFPSRFSPARVGRRCPEFHFDLPHRRISEASRAVRWSLVVVMLALVVHPPVVAARAEAADRSGEQAADVKLPPLVVEMRDRIMAAVTSGHIADLREPLEWNEMPVVSGGTDAGEDPIAHWIRQSSDGTGKSILVDIGRALALPPVKLALGRDTENTAVFVWPYLSERPLDRLTPGEEKDLLTLMPADTAVAMRTKGRWTWWRLVIGADGTWHAFTRGE